MLGVGLHLEGHEVAQVEAPGLLEAVEDPGGRTDDAKIDVPRGPGAFEAEFEREPALERRGVAEDERGPRQKALEDQQLPGGGRRRGPSPTRSSAASPGPA
jgi:hypothetical protein